MILKHDIMYAYKTYVGISYEKKMVKILQRLSEKIVWKHYGLVIGSDLYRNPI